MLVRLLLVLLLAFGTPTVVPAACAQPAQAHHAMPGMPDTPTPEKAVAPHLCVGCIPLGDWLRAPLAEPMPMPRADFAALVARLDLKAAGPPALPPPRAG